MLWLAFQVLLVAYLPGALMLRLPGRSQAYRASLPADERLFWSVILSVAWSTMAVVTLALAGRYSFDRLLVINAVGIVVALAVARQRLRFPRPVTRMSLQALVPVGLIVLGWWMYFPPTEYVTGGRDPGTYMNEGIQIAQRGQLVLTDPVVAAVPPPLRDLFFPSHGTDLYYGLRFVGFFVQDPDTGGVVGQFPHLYPASIAIGYGLNGLSGARQAVGVWAILGLIAVYFAGARLFGRTAAGVACALLAVNVVTVWFARYPNAELVMQALLFAALLALTRALDQRQWFFPAVAGALLGSMLFLRFDTVLPIGACLTAAALLPAVRARIGHSFPIVLAIVGAVGFWYLTGPMRAYAYYPLAFTRETGAWVLVCAAVAAWCVTPRVLAIGPIASTLRHAIPVGLALSFSALAGYAYFFRQMAGRTAIHDAEALRTYAWYVTPWVVGLAVAGYAALVTRRFWRHPAFFLAFATFAVFFFYKIRIVPEHFWATRRFLPMILPGTLLLAAALASETIGPRGLSRLAGWIRREQGVKRPRWIPIAGTVLLGATMTPLAVSYWNASQPVRHHVEYAGLIPRLEHLAGRIGDRDLLLVEGRNAGTDLHVLAMPLAYIYARNVLVLDSAVPSKRLLEAFIAWASERYDTIWFLGGGGTDLLTGRITIEPVAHEGFQVPEYDAPLNAYPRGVRRKEFEYGLYRLSIGTPTEPGPIDLRIGGADDLHVVRFHARERHADGTQYRWTGPQSFILLPALSSTARALVLWMGAGGRPAHAPVADVEVAVDDEIVGRVTVGETIEPFTFVLPPDLVARLAERREPFRVRLRVPTWQPSAILGANDTRDLGVMVTRVQVP